MTRPFGPPLPPETPREIRIDRLARNILTEVIRSMVPGLVTGFGSLKADAPEEIAKAARNIATAVIDLEKGRD